ncbi:hypothetical protein LH128_11778 [Sphingomonas sp. LH128]|nr:hypothetical protein LH128_11778 [Sphingomonas sp. LH128]
MDGHVDPPEFIAYSVVQGSGSSLLLEVVDGGVSVDRFGHKSRNRIQCRLFCTIGNDDCGAFSP